MFLCESNFTLFLLQPEEMSIRQMPAKSSQLLVLQIQSVHSFTHIQSLVVSQGNGQTTLVINFFIGGTTPLLTINGTTLFLNNNVFVVQLPFHATFVLYSNSFIDCWQHIFLIIYWWHNSFIGYYIDSTTPQLAQLMVQCFCLLLYTSCDSLVNYYVLLLYLLAPTVTSSTTY